MCHVGCWLWDGKVCRRFAERVRTSSCNASPMNPGVPCSRMLVVLSHVSTADHHKPRPLQTQGPASVPVTHSSLQYTSVTMLPRKQPKPFHGPQMQQCHACAMHKDIHPTKWQAPQPFRTCGRRHMAYHPGPLSRASCLPACNQRFVDIYIRLATESVDMV